MAAPDIQDIYPLSPLQQGILFHDIYSPELRVYCLQMTCELRGGLEPEVLRSSWEKLLDRHSVLRTAFVWERQGEPLQVVHRRVELPWREDDWRDLDRDAQEQRLRVLLREDHQQGFDVSRAPLMRFHLIRVRDDSYRFVWTYHHLLMDGWSKYLVLQDAFELYFAAQVRRPPQLQVSRPFGDYIGWLQQQALDGAVGFWRGYLQGFSAPTPLGIDVPRGLSREREEGSSRCDRTLDAEPTTALRAMAARHQLTFNTLLQAAWALLLHRYSGAGDIVFGATVSGRPAALDGVESMVGMMINTLPVRVCVDLDGPLTSWLEALQKRFTELRDWEFSPLVQVQQWSEMPGQEALFESILVLENFPIREGAVGGNGSGGGGLEIADVEGVEATNYPLTLMVSATDRLFLTIFYDRSRFDRTAVARALAHLEELLRALASEPRTAAELDPLRRAERHQLLHEWNATEVPYPRVELIQSRFEERVRTSPEAVAVRAGERLVSYGELDRRADDVARQLRAAGVVPETRVGVLTARSIEMVVAILGVLKAGGAYVPLDPAFPEERLSYMLTASGAPVLLAQGAIDHPLAGDRPGLEVRRLIASDVGVAGETDVRAENLAYVIFTSGSTGRPKGVQICHRTLVNFLRSMENEPGLDASDRFFSVTTLSFDIAALEIFLPLSVGAQVVLSGETFGDAERLRSALERSNATVVQATPATWRLLIDAGWEGDPALKVLCGGEALPGELARELSTQAAELWNLYGPTETTVWSAVEFVDSPPPSATTESIGRPIANTDIHLLDAAGAPAPLAVAGELVIAGEGLSRGYLDQPGLTAQLFCPDPFARRPGARCYHTGDLARRLADGRIEFLGRQDYQVKVRGFRIELGEIEAALEGHPGIDQVVATALRDSAGSGFSRLVAYLVTTTDPAPSVGELRTFLERSLPDYMIPSAFIPLEALPLTPNGKIDRKALPAPDAARLGLGREAKAPRTPIEQQLATIWRELLGVEDLGVEDSFFELGGHSLLATQLVARVREAFGLDVPLRHLLERPTVAGQAAAVARRRAAGPDSATPAAALPSIVPDPDSRYQPFPLTEVQQAYWVGSQGAFDIGNVAAHGYGEQDLAVDVERFDQALRRLIERHDMLRAVVRPDGQQQILETVPPYEVATLDLRGVDSEEAARRLAEVRASISHQVRPSDRWPLFEIRASILEEGRIRLHVSRDLLLMDAWSMHIFGRELDLLLEDPEAELEPLELSFRDYMMVMDELQQGELYQRAKDYWSQRLETLPPAPELPLAKAPSSLSDPRFSRREATLPAGQWQRLKRRAASSGLTPSGVLLAAYAEILATWSKNPRFTVNLTIFNRLPLHPQVNDIVGDFTSIILLEVDASSRRSLELRARALQERLWEDLEHRYVSGVEVMRDLSRKHGRSSGALMPVVFTSMIFDPAREPADTTEDLDATNEADHPPRRRPSVDGISQTPQVWIDCQVSERADGGLDFNFDAVDELFPPALLDDMFDAYSELIWRLATGEAAWSEEGRPWTPAAHLARRAEINDTAAPVPEGLLHTAALRQALRAPSHPAVATTDRVLTYGELRTRAHLLADRLRRLGAKPNRLIAIVMHKGWEEVVATLGILQSGGAYLPVDAALPSQRVCHLLERGEVEIAVTQAGLEDQVEWPEGVERVVIEAAIPSGEEMTELEPVQEATDLAYVIFTSGSTGSPKGVMIDHRGALNTVVDINQRFGVNADDRVLGLSSLGFDLSVWDIFGTLAAGGTLVLPPPEARRDPAAWLRLMERHQVTVWNTVPALMQMLVEYSEGRSGVDFGPLRLVMLSGDWIPIHLPDRIRRRAPKVQVWSLGGATEASIWSILYPIEEVGHDWTSIPYGRPMVNQSLQVLDELLEPRPLWVPGQLYIGGVGLARGYWRDAEKTAASFFEHPRTGERLYRTGDLGRYLPSGDLEFLGREDFQVKIQGHRIELGEIEAVIEDHAEVRAGVVAAVGDDRHHRRLVAWVVPEEIARETSAGEEETRNPTPEVAGAGESTAAPERTSETNDDHDHVSLAVHSEASEALATAARAADQQAGPLTGALISTAAFGRLLACLRSAELEEITLPKYRYASAGNLYPVQVYVHVASDRVEGISTGTYYFHPRECRLYPLASGAVPNREIHSSKNRQLFDHAVFSLVLVAQRDAIRPIYGDSWWDFSVLEAGYMGQLLTTEAAAAGIVLASVAGIENEALRELFQLEPSHYPVHALVAREAAGSGSTPGSSRPGYGLRSDDYEALVGASRTRHDERASTAPVTPAPETDLQRLEFKLAEHGLRRMPAGTEGIELSDGRARGEEFLRPYRERRSHREYLKGPIDAGALGRLMEGLRARPRNGDPVARAFLYPSAADLYPVKTYLHVKRDRVAGLQPGVYLYDPEHHVLRLLAGETPLPASLHATVNRPIATAAAFTLLFAAAAEADSRARDFCLLEAGYMSHLLMSLAPALAIGLCPIGTFRFDAVREAFGAGEEHFLHALVGGAIAPVEASAETRPAASAIPTPQGKPEATPSQLERRLTRHLTERLPRYMLPSRFVFLEALPLSRNGKVDRSALPDASAPEAEVRSEFVAPESDLERRLAQAWRETLGIDQVGIYDNFFDLGGNSVHVVQVHARLSQTLPQDVELIELFNHTTISALAAHLGQQRAEPRGFDEATRRAQKHREAMRRQKRKLRRRRSRKR